ncbi:hypothetical protein DUNSADRAFT_13241 [Dunaliella salina]|uniref:DUF1995 domain-containing protein n=1 Tax=Dunaliella salina TaxID=3046 RepID=A0ABQ7H3C4_DUNSA|nr:hypothetical protein DUNSADRAFT_13241 [Dunaliella salina]|eukprot:KAF5841373.1 hypothetical protein DUNSADRAFT_13241 [Dunaliella salina]
MQAKSCRQGQCRGKAAPHSPFIPHPALNSKHLLRCASPQATSSSAQGSPSQVVVRIPESKEEAITDAVRAATTQLQPQAKSKGFSKGGGGRQYCLCIDLPIASEGVEDVADLGKRVSLEITHKLNTPCTVVFADEQAAEACLREGKSRSVAIMHLREACRKPMLSGGVLVIVAPKIADVALCDQLVQEVWTGSGALLVNSEFAVTPLTEASSDLQPFLQSLATVYAFQPVAVKGLLGNMEGAVLKRVESGDPGATPYKMLKQVKGEFVQIGQSLKRPDNDDLEATFINASAAQSPLTKAARAIRGVFSKDKK